MVEFFGTVGRALRRGRVLVALAGSLAVLLVVVAGAFAAAPTLSGTFTCSKATPCGTFESWSPARLAVNEQTGDVYVIDVENNVVDAFSAAGVYETSIAEPFSFGGDDDVAVDNSGGPNEGNVYVVSENAGKLYAFKPNGSLLWESSENVGDPCGIAVDPTGNVWSADANTGLLRRNAATGESIPGSMLLEGSVPCHFAFDSEGNILLNHFGLNVDKYDSQGNLLKIIDGLSNRDVATDSRTGNIYTDHGNGIALYGPLGNAFSETPFGGGTISNSVGVTMNGVNGKVYVSDNGNNQVLVYDAPPENKLTVSKPGSGAGSVASVPAGIECGMTCNGFYEPGTKVTLTATPAAHSRFKGWSGGGCSGTGTCEVTLGSDVSVSAEFEAIPTFELKVEKTGSTGSGTVSSAPSGIGCLANGTGNCSHSYDEGTPVTLTASPVAHSKLTGWIVTGQPGACPGIGPCTVTLNADTVVTAIFAQDKPVVTTGAAGSITQTAASVAGTVNPSGAEITGCHIDYGTTEAYGAQVSCSPAGPGSGVTAVGVTGALAGLNAGTAYHYRVVATNVGGTTDGPDQTFTTETPPVEKPVEKPAEKPVEKIIGKSLPPAGSVSVSGGKVKKGKLQLTVVCKGLPESVCRGTLKLTVKVKQGKKSKTVTVATVSYSLGVGQSKTFTLKLSSTVTKLLKKAHHLKAAVTGPGVNGKLTIG